ncbi:MAG: acetoacetate decarboxylase [Ilumatobacteraceae bacterium]|nr:acetoacetate decarboxylase [Ilumatobacteraceae bacterium]
MALPDPITPGDYSNWPTLRVIYRTDPDRIADLLPPGITPGAEPHVHLHVYQVPIAGEPEFGVVIMVPARYDGIEGLYNIGYGIDQEQAIFISNEINGQPKFPCTIKYFRIGNHVVARAYHQGYTFLEFSGEVVADISAEGEQTWTEHQWWLKYSRAVGGTEKRYDFPPHVVKVSSTSSLVYRIQVDGDLVLRDSPWDPIAELLPMREQVAAHLQKSQMDYSTRSLTLAGALDPDAFWPHTDTIGNSRWPGMNGGPRRRL